MVITVVFKSTKEFANLWLKWTNLLIQKIGKLQDFEFLVYLTKRILLLFKQFLSRLFFEVSDFFWLVIFEWPHILDPYNRWKQKREWYFIFIILRGVLEDSHLCFWIALLYSMCNFFLLHQSLSSSAAFYAVSSNTEKVFPINPSAHVFFFVYLNIHHKD